MLTGTMIDELIDAVERAERDARTDFVMTVSLPPRRESYPAFTYMYDFATMQQTVVGVA